MAWAWRTHSSMWNVLVPFEQHMGCHFSGHKRALRVVLDSSRLPLHPGAVCVTNEQPVRRMRLFFSSPLSSLFSTLTLQKIKASLHFVISWHLVHVRLITICLVKMIHELGFFFNFIFFFIFHIWSPTFNWYCFYLIWFLKVSLKKNSSF
jgi:hypothetical protein